MRNTESMWLNVVCALLAYFVGCYTVLALVNRKLTKTLGKLQDLLQLLSHPVYMRKEIPDAKNPMGSGSGTGASNRGTDPQSTGSTERGQPNQINSGTVETNSGGSGGGGQIMNAYPRGLSPMLAWEEAFNYRALHGVERIAAAPEMRARTEYALRRIGGLKYLEAKMDEFCQAFNEAPFEDSDEDTALQPDEQMKRMSDGGVQRVMR